MFLIGLKSIIGDGKDIVNLTEEEVTQIPNWNYVVPLFIGAIVAMIIVFAALVLMLRKIGVWSRNGEKQEALIQH